MWKTPGSRTCWQQQAEAGIKLNTETLKALAVADRSLLYYSLDQKGWIGSGHARPIAT